MSWRNRIVGFDPAADPTQLLANPSNWRLHPGDQRDALRGSLSQVGWVSGVMVNVTTGHVVDGHARVEEALSAEQTVPVLYVELEPDEEWLVLATYDPMAAMARTDHEQLGALLHELELDTDEGLSELLVRLEAEVAAGPPPAEPGHRFDLGPVVPNRVEVTLRCWPEELDEIRSTLEGWAARGMHLTIR